MTDNIALVGRRELIAHRRFVTGVTVSVPQYIDVDGDGNKEWVVDVFLGPLEPIKDGILEDVIIAPIAKALVTDIRQPVVLERARDGRYQVTGRGKLMPAGLDIGGGMPTETYVETRHNYADLRLRFLADLDWELEVLQGDPLAPFQEDEDEPFQLLRARNAFGRLVVGPEDEVNAEFADVASAQGAVAQAMEVRVRVRLEPLQATPDTPFQADPDEPFQAMVRDIIEVPA